MSGRTIVAYALADANDEKNDGNGYTVNLWLRSGRQVHGSVYGGEMRVHKGGLLLELELWEPRPDADLAPTGRHVLIDPEQVEQIEVCW
jgi:hypothetical protein